MIKIFYSWQSWTDRKVNQYAIRDSLMNISKDENLNNGADLYIDQATRDVPGSPQIPDTIINKIVNCQIFVCDITTINKNSVGRKTPNPNVLIELGFAIATLGFDRIIMLFNEAKGVFPDDVPFDLDRRRISKYKLIDTDDNNSKKQLTKQLSSYINLIISKNPTKPYYLIGKSEEEVKRISDIKNIKEFFRRIDLNAFDQFLNKLPHFMTQKGLLIIKELKSLTSSSLFYVYSPSLKNSIDELMSDLIQLFDLVYIYHFKKNDEYKFTLTPNQTKEYKETTLANFNIVSKLRPILKRKIDELTNFIRENYVEIDLIKLSREAEVGLDEK